MAVDSGRAERQRTSRRLLTSSSRPGWTRCGCWGPLYGSLLDPFTGMAFALSRTTRLKAGSGVSVLPGRHPVLVAKQLASLAALAQARVLPVFGLRRAREAEIALFPVPAGRARRRVRRVADPAANAADLGERVV